jgi:hypothetical protein
MKELEHFLTTHIILVGLILVCTFALGVGSIAASIRKLKDLNSDG